MKKKTVETKHQNGAGFLDVLTGIELSDEELRQIIGAGGYSSSYGLCQSSGPSTGIAPSTGMGYTAGLGMGCTAGLGMGCTAGLGMGCTAGLGMGMTTGMAGCGC